MSLILLFPLLYKPGTQKCIFSPADGLLTTVSAVQSRLLSSQEIPKNRTESRKPMRIEDYEPGHSSIVSDEGLRVGSFYIVCSHLLKLYFKLSVLVQLSA